MSMKYFMFNHSGSRNHGCEAIVRGTMNIIENADNGAAFVLSSYDPDSDTGLEGVELRTTAMRPLSGFEKIVSALNVKLKHSEYYAYSKMYSDLIGQAEDCDVCLSIGGDTYCYGDNAEIRVVTSEIKKLGKKLVLWGASVGEEDLDENKLENLRLFDAVFAREPLTYDLLKSRGANANIFLHADPAFCMERDDVEPIEGFDKLNTIGFNISPLIAARNPAILEISEAFIKYILEGTTLNVLLVPHVVVPGNNDYDYMLPMYIKFKETGRVKILSPDLNAKQYKGYIAGTRFFIGARTHATIAAYSSGVPTAVLGYSVKSRGISKDLFGEEKYVIDSRTLSDEKELIDQFELLVSEEDGIRKTLLRTIPIKLRSAMEAGRILRDL